MGAPVIQDGGAHIVDDKVAELSKITCRGTL